MKFYKGITFRLYVILSVFLVGFICLLMYFQIFVVGRSYMITEHSQARETELRYELFEDFIQSYKYVVDNENDEKFAREALADIFENFESKNNVFIMALGNDYKINHILTSTAELLKQPLLNNISYDIKNNTDARKMEFSFRIFDQFHLPTKYIGFSIPLETERFGTQYIVVVFQDVFTDNSSGILKGYIFYVLIASIIIALIITGILSYIVTRPVIKINKTALKMIDMDFTVRCEVKSSDEMGTLANSLNFLSDKLNSTIKRLKHANDKLKKDLDMQKELDLLRKEFIAGVSHEFKTPITIIKGYTEGIIDDVMSPCEKEEALKIIMSETSKMDHLVQGLLDISTMEAPNYTLHLSEVYIEELLKTIIKKYTYIMKEMGMEFIADINCSSCMVKIDTFRIEQVITNFINNAMSNTEKSKKITLSGKLDNNMVMIAVENEGPHIGEEHLSRIWEKFYRIDKSRSKKSGGTGLGLAISKIILELHGSKFGVNNTENGVKFFFELRKLNK